MAKSNITLPFAKSHAFIIGINAYEHVSKLGTAVQDAEDIAKLLKDKKKHGYETHLLTDGNKVEMLAFFEEMKATVKAKDRVIFYFAGHGIALDSEGDPEGFLVPVDAEPNDKESLIPMKVLHDTLTDLPCNHGLLILDCCFAGAFKWSTGFRDTVFNFGQKLYAERFRRFVDHPAWQVITSSAHDQKASDVLNKQALGLREEEVKTKSKNSPFAWALKKAIDLHSKADIGGEKGGNGVITATELYLYLREIVETATSDGLKRQSPAIFTLGKHDTKGEYIFLNPGHRLNLPKAPDTNPYKGLGAYGASEADVQTFFGRTQAIETMVEKLEETSVLLISAPSGQGKSSVVKAGLFSAIREEGDPAPIVLRPGERAFENWDALGTLDPVSRQVVLIDQYEEMFDLDEFDQESFEGQLIELMKKVDEAENPALKLILTLRSDFEWQMTASAFGKTFWEAGSIRKFLYRLPPMTPEELREIMVKPAWAVAYEFESDELINQILEEINHSPGALPLLSFTLHKLYEERNKTKRLLTVKAYKDKLGGVNGALSKHADAVYEKMPSPAHQDFMRKLIIRMIRLNDGSYSRRRVYLEIPSLKEGVESIDELDYPDHLDAIKDEVLEILEEALLVIRDKDKFGLYVEPMHDSLINFWPRCLQWIQDFGRENLILQRQLWQAVVEHHKWEKDIYSSANGREARAPLWENNPKLQQVQIAVTDPQNDWLCNKGWVDTNISAYAYLLWEQNPTPTQMAELAPWKEYFTATTDKDRYAEVQAQMDHWLNEEEMAFVKQSFERQRSEIEKLTRERDDARATALAAKALKFYPEDNTLGLNLAYAGYLTTPNEETISALADLLNKSNSQYYQRFEGHTGSVYAVACSPDGTLIISGSEDKTLKLWLAETGKELKTFEGHTDFVRCVAFSPDGSYILSGSTDTTIRLWSVATGKEIKCFQGHTSLVSSVSFSPDGTQIVSGSWDKTFRLWSVKSGEEVKRFEGFGQPVWSVAFSPDGTQIISGSSERVIRLWSAVSGEEIKSFEGHKGPALSVGFSPDGSHIISGSTDKALILWSVESGEAVQRFEGHTSPIISVAFSRDGTQVISGSKDKTLRLWSVESGVEVKCFEGHNDAILAVAFPSSGTEVISGSYDKTLRLWHLSSGEKNISFEGHTENVNSVAFSPDGSRIISASDDKTLCLWAAESGEEIRRFEHHTDKVNSVAFSHDGTRIVSGSDDKILLLWSVETGKVLQRFEGHTDAVSAVAFSPDSTRIISGSADMTLRLWSVETGKALKKFEGHTQNINAVAFSPDGSQVTSGANDETLRIWSVDSGKEIKCFEGQSINAVAFSPDGACVIGGARNKNIHYWSVKSGQQIGIFEGHTSMVADVAFSKDGTQIISGSNDKTLRLWSVETGQQTNSFVGHNVRAVAFSPDGTLIISGSWDNTILLRRIVLDSWIPRVYKLNEADRKKYKVLIEY